MGRTYVKPFVNEDKKLILPPKLKWYKIFCNYEHSGDILASFELILLKDVSEKFIKNKLHSIKFILIKSRTKRQQ